MAPISKSPSLGRGGIRKPKGAALNKAFANAVDTIGSVAFHYPKANGADRLNAARTLSPSDTTNVALNKASFTDDLGGAVAVRLLGKGRNAGMFSLNNYPHSALIHANGDVAPRSPYPGHLLGMVGKVANDAAIQAVFQAWVDDAAGI